MNFQKLFETQKVLDDRIVKEHGLEKDELIFKKALALQVEIGELANETRCFKFWSNKPASDKENILTEYVDGLHFILSIGNYIRRNYYTMNHLRITMERMKERTVVDQFNLVFRFANLMNEDDYYRELFASYLVLGEMLGFTLEEIEQAYFKKNEVNHQRQDSGY